METKIFTVDNILVLMTWGYDKKVYVKYFQNNLEIIEWEKLELWQRDGIEFYCRAYCREHNLALWSY